MEACIFDLDGVIVDTARFHFLAWKRLASKLGIELTEQYNEKLKGVSRLDSLNFILELKKIKLTEDEKMQLAEKKNARFVEYIHAMNPRDIYPGVPELLSELKSVKIKVGLASSSKNAHLVLAQLGISDQFEVIVDGTMITHTKPHPEIFLKTAALLTTPPAKCLVIEDAAAGVAAAKAAGMSCIGIGEKSVLNQADLVVNNIAELSLTVLNQLMQHR
ncbi:MAG: beta-phosphoglucomutase [Flammeovirgaceae bacterium]|nr:MAG: beta-phosphoglucomutase [Flammeovirgaceae bacterium]